MSTCNYYTRENTPLVVYDSDDYDELEWRAEDAEDAARAVEWIRGWISEGWTELGVAGVFSNGEAVYFQIAPRRVYVTGPESVAEPVHIAFYSKARA